jgi:hypothetical protein
MKCFEIAINGEKVCLAGHEKNLSLSAAVTTFKNESTSLNIGSLLWEEGEIGGEDVFWEYKELGIGDAVSITIVESIEPDKPEGSFSSGVKIGPPTGVAKACSFCYKGEESVSVLIEGHQANICNECAGFYAERCVEEINKNA